MQTFKNEWNENEFSLVPRKLAKYFKGKTLIDHNNQKLYFNGSIAQIENCFGIPYTSSSSFALMSLDCNEEFKLTKNDRFHFSYVAINQKNEIVLCLHDNEENETFITI